MIPFFEWIVCFVVACSVVFCDQRCLFVLLKVRWALFFNCVTRIYPIAGATGSLFMSATYCILRTLAFFHVFVPVMRAFTFSRIRCANGDFLKPLAVCVLGTHTLHVAE
jgi:hypothetical protein